MRIGLAVLSILLCITFQPLAVTAKNEQKDVGKSQLLPSPTFDIDFGDVLVFSGEGSYPTDHEWNIPKNVINENDGIEINLFAYDETVDPAFKLGNYTIDERHDNYEHRDFRKESKTPYDLKSIEIYSEYSQEFNYYLEIVYHKNSEGITNPKSNPLPPGEGQWIEIQNPFDRITRLDIDLWFIDEKLKIIPLNKENGFEIDVYDSAKQILRKTSVEGTQNSRVVRLDACMPNETFKILLRNAISVKENPTNIEGYKEYKPQYQLNTKENIQAFLMCNFIKYGNKATKKIHISSSIKSENDIYVDRFTGSIRADDSYINANTHEIPIAGKMSDEGRMSEKESKQKSTRLTQKDYDNLPKGLDENNKFIVEKIDGVDNSEYDYFPTLNVDNITKPFIDHTKSDLEKNTKHEESPKSKAPFKLDWYNNSILWHFLVSKNTSQSVTVQWSGSSELDMDVFSKLGNDWKFYRKASSNNKNENPNNKEKSLSMYLEANQEYFISVSLKSNDQCEYRISSGQLETLKDQPLVLSGNESRVFSLKSPSQISFYQEQPEKPILKIEKLEVSNNAAEWESIADANSRYNIFKKENDSEILIKISNIGENSVECWLKIADITQNKSEDRSSKNDKIWNAEQVVDLAQDRICVAKGEFAPIGDTVDYWKINIDENIIDDKSDAKKVLKIHYPDDIKVSLFPGKQEADGNTTLSEFNLQNGIYTYYIKVQPKPKRTEKNYSLRFYFGEYEKGQSFEFDSIEVKEVLW
jgi:hypothetical protein